MGVGKSTIGRKLAQTLDLPFRDADTEIEKAAGRSISDIFAALGEDVGDRPAGGLLDFGVGVTEGEVQGLGELSPDGGFPYAHEAHKRYGAFSQSRVGAHGRARLRTGRVRGSAPFLPAPF